MSKDVGLHWGLGLLAAVWLGFFLDWLLPLHYLGLVPRTPRGLLGVVFMPFVHGSFSHLLSNTVPLAVLLGLLLSLGRPLGVLLPSISLLGGGLLWCFGRSANHIGASVLVFGLAAYLIFSAWRQRRFTALLAAAVVAFLYGSSLLGGLWPLQPGVSWEGHLFGAVAGAFIALREPRR